MIGNYIDIDYEKLPKRQPEEKPETEKDYSSIKKLLSHPQYKDIIGLYTGKGKATPVSKNQSFETSGLDGNGAQFASPLGFAAGALPILGGAAASTGAALRGTVKGPKTEAFRVPSKKDEPPVLDDMQGRAKPEELPEGVESAKPAEVDTGVEGDVEDARLEEIKSKFIDDIGLSVDEVKDLLTLLDDYNNIDLGDDDSIEAPEGTEFFKVNPEEKKQILREFLNRHPDWIEKLLGNDDAAVALRNNFNNAIDDLVKHKLEKRRESASEFNLKDKKAQAKRADLEHDKRANEIELVDKEKMDPKANAYFDSKVKTRNITRKNESDNLYEEVPKDKVQAPNTVRHEEAAQNQARIERIIRAMK